MARKITRLGLAIGFVRALALIFAFGALLHPRRLPAEERFESNLWEAVAPYSPDSLSPKPNIQPDTFLAVNLDYSQLQALLNSARKALNQSATLPATVIALPLPDGKLMRYRFV